MLFKQHQHHLMYYNKILRTYYESYKSLFLKRRLNSDYYYFPILRKKNSTYRNPNIKFKKHF